MTAIDTAAPCTASAPGTAIAPDGSAPFRSEVHGLLGQCLLQLQWAERGARGLAGGAAAALPMRSDACAQPVGALRGLAQVRRALVHRFVDQFDLHTAAGCAQAHAYLQGCAREIARHGAQLHTWADDLARTQAAAAGLADALHAALRDVAPLGGMARLDEVLRWLAHHHPAQTPAAHGCHHWRQVLQQAAPQFELHYRAGSEGGRVGWLRERQPLPAMPPAGPQVLRPQQGLSGFGAAPAP